MRGLSGAFFTFLLYWGLERVQLLCAQRASRGASDGVTVVPVTTAVTTAARVLAFRAYSAAHGSIFPVGSTQGAVQ